MKRLDWTRSSRENCRGAGEGQKREQEWAVRMEEANQRREQVKRTEGVL
jgi:hypothetical protein